MANNLSDTSRRVLVGAGLVVVAGLVAWLEYLGVPAVRWLAIIVALWMIVEMIMCMVHVGGDAVRKNSVVCVAFLAWLCLVLCAAAHVGTRPWIMLLLLMIISFADMGAWLFGRIFGGDKMWERLSANKTWAGQIAGIACGTFASVMYGLLGTDTFMPQLMWIGISIALLSQYGDLTASWIKRRLGIKDFGRILPGHGGMLDRFDGWIYVLPLVWLVMM